MEHIGLGCHLGGDAIGELFHLSAKVEEEGVALPAAHEHDGGGADIRKVEEHCAAGAQGVCANTFDVDSEAGWADGEDGRFEVSAELFGGDAYEFLISEEGIDRGMGCGFGVLEDA